MVPRPDSSPPTTADEYVDRGFRVRLARSGREFWVPAGASILQTLEAAGMDLPYSCREGQCGTCMQTVLCGAVDHRDYVLSDEQRADSRSMLICVSRARDEVIELDI